MERWNKAITMGAENVPMLFQGLIYGTGFFDDHLKKEGETMHADNIDDQAVQKKLKLWGAWQANQHGAPKLKAMTSAEILMKSATDYRNNLPVFDENDEPEAKEVEKMMCKLLRFNDLLYKALEYEYSENITIKEGAIKMNCSESTYRAYRAYGEKHIAGQMAANFY